MSDENKTNVLFIGVCADGEWRQVQGAPDAIAVLNAPALVEPVKVAMAPAATFTREVYREAWLQEDDGKRLRVYVWDGLGREKLCRTLVYGYRPLGLKHNGNLGALLALWKRNAESADETGDLHAAFIFRRCMEELTTMMEGSVRGVAKLRKAAGQ